MHPDYGYGRQFLIDGYMPAAVSTNPSITLTDSRDKVLLKIDLDPVAETVVQRSELNHVSEYLLSLSCH